MNNLLKDAQLTRAELSRITGISTRQISNWNNREIPKWAIAYLELRAKYLRLLDKI
ncbi:helix-turn-helix domain-containing protein [Gilliamella sp. B3482]|nr:helix-turn-helix domain-containing protein [Gilliamella sp. B3482]